jgi:hypothetical protein
VELFGEEAGLAGSGGRGWLSTGDANNTENRDFGERRTRYKDAVRGGVQIRRRNLHAIIEKRDQVVRRQAFQSFPVGIAQADPEPVQLGPAKKGLALRLERRGFLSERTTITFLCVEAGVRFFKELIRP